MIRKIIFKKSVLYTLYKTKIFTIKFFKLKIKLKI